MSLALYGHPFSSYTQKVLIALYENDTPFEFRSLGRIRPQLAAEWLRRWPLRKFPLLLDGERAGGRDQHHHRISAAGASRAGAR